jgi:cyclin-dependent kinase 12/13
MIDANGIIKIADFGISIYVDDACRKLHRLPPAWYRSPEFLLGDRQYGTSTDMWSIGVVIGELINRHIVFPSRSEIEQILMIYRLLGSPNDKTWPEAKTFRHFLQFNDESLLNHDETFEKKFPRANEQELILLKSLLVMNPKYRATAKQALESSYFTSNPPACKPEDIPRLAAPRHRHSRDPFHMNDISINDENLPSDYSHLNTETKRQLFSP